MWKFINDKYVKKIYAPKNVADPATEFLEGGNEKEEKEEEKDEEKEEEEPVEEPQQTAQPKAGLLDFDLEGDNKAELAPDLKADSTDFDFSFKGPEKTIPKTQPKSDLLSIFDDEPKKASAPVISKPQDNFGYKNPISVPRPMIGNKYAALDFVQAPIINNNVYNIYNNYNMNISSGSTFSAKPNANGAPIPYQFNKPKPRPYPEQKSESLFKDVLPDDF